MNTVALSSPPRALSMVAPPGTRVSGCPVSAAIVFNPFLHNSLSLSSKSPLPSRRFPHSRYAVFDVLTSYVAIFAITDLKVMLNKKISEDKDFILGRTGVIAYMKQNIMRNSVNVLKNLSMEECFKLIGAVFTTAHCFLAFSSSESPLFICRFFESLSLCSVLLETPVISNNLF